MDLTVPYLIYLVKKNMNKFLEFNLVKFPIIFPILYGFFLFQFPQHETLLILITLFLLAEPHFGATWTIFFNRHYANEINENKFQLIFVPILIIFYCFFGYFYFTNLFLLTFFIFNLFHVTRQSSGIFKLYNSKIKNLKFFTNSIYLVNFWYLFIGILRFMNLIDINFYIILTLISLIIISVLIFAGSIMERKFELNLIFLTGLLIFLPICFVNNPVHALIMGVTMHYTQYLFLTHKVYKGRKQNELKNKNYFFIIIFIYGLIMTLFAAQPKLFANDVYKDLILIPIIGQILHFYLDSFIWKFSKEINRNITLRYIQ